MATATQSKWQEVLDQVMDELRTENFVPGGSFYTLDDLCRRYNVSNITGRRVFQELKDRGSIVTRGRRGTFVTHATTRQTIYMCVRDECFNAPELLNNFRFLHAFSLGFMSSDVARLFQLEPISIDFMLQHLDAFADKPLIVSADVLLQVNGQEVRIDKARLALLRHLDPIFFHAFPGLEGVIQVGTDLHSALYQPMQHLLGKGHRRIGLLIGQTSSPWFQPRLQAYLDALHHAGLPFAPELVRVTTGTDLQEDHAAAEAMMTLPEPPTAIACANDTRALHLLDYCALHAIHIPHDLAVTGADNIPEAQVCSPALTTCDSRNADKGARVAEILMRRLQGETIPTEPDLLQPRFIVRQST